MDKNKKPSSPAGFRGGPMGMQGKPEKPKNFKKTAKIASLYLKPYVVYLVLVFVSAIISTIFAIAGPKILGNMTTEIVKGLMSRTGIDFTAIAMIGWTLVGLYVASSVFGYLQSWLMTTVAQKITYTLRQKVSEKISRLPLSYFDKHEKGEIISHVTNDIETISQNLNQSLTQIITSIITIIGILAMMLSISLEMTGIALLVLPVSMIFIGVIVKKSQGFYEKQQSALAEIDGHIEEMFSNHAIVKTFNGEKASIDKFGKINAKLKSNAWKSQFLSGLMMPIMQFISNVGYVGVAVVGGWLAINNRISIGDIQAFIQYMSQFTQPISQTANVVNVLQSTAAAAERVFDFIDQPEELVQENPLARPSKINGEVEFRKVNFGYDDKLIIKNFSVKIESKQRVAIVGPTGAGKTTLVNLLMRFYDLNSGEILIDGVDISKYNKQDVRKMFGMVLQDTWLFEGTIADNIAYGHANATRSQIIESAKAAHADHFISTLPDGYDTIISETADSISAGEKQLITIARAILADAPMLILDEATSSVDTRTESLIQSAMDKLSHNRTSFVIAHRLSTIKNADLILVIKSGNIVEQGTHKELLSKKGYYTELYNSQFSQV